MRSCYFLALTTLLIGAAHAQTLPTPSGLSILKKEWRINREAPVNPVLLEDPFEAVDRTNVVTRDPKTIIRENKRRSLKGLGPEPVQETTEVVTSTHENSSGDRSNTFVYQIRLRNDGERTVKYIEWDYVFLDPATREEVGRHSFISTTDLRPSQTSNISVKRVSPPARTVRAVSEERNANSYTEFVVINRVRFADGSQWVPPAYR
jgi:hypothetical protein